MWLRIASLTVGTKSTCSESPVSSGFSSSSDKPYTPVPGTVDASFDMKTGVRDQVDALSVTDYFTYLARPMKTNPPAAADAPMIEKLKAIGIEPGKDFDASKLSARQGSHQESAEAGAGKTHRVLQEGCRTHIEP